MTASDQYQYQPPDWFKYFLIALAVLWLGFLLTGCTTTQKAVRVLEKKGKLAEVCATNYPVRDSTVYLPGRIIVKHHTDTIPGDSIPCPEQLPGQPPAVVHCPPSVHTTDTIYRHDTTLVIRENIAQIAALQQQLAIATGNYEKSRKWKPRALWTWGILAVLIGGGVILKIKSII